MLLTHIVDNIFEYNERWVSELPWSSCRVCGGQIIRYRPWKDNLFRCACSYYWYRFRSKEWEIVDRRTFSVELIHPKGSKVRNVVLISMDDGTKGSQVPERIHLARLMMECSLGRKLARKEVVHHRDHNPLNDTIENLELMSLSDHAKHHSRDRIRNKITPSGDSSSAPPPASSH